MIEFQFDPEWLILIPIIGQATEHAAATAHMAAQRAAIMAGQSVIQPPRYVPFIRALTRIGTFLYFIPSAISRTVKLTIPLIKRLTLEVFGSGQ